MRSAIICLLFLLISGPAQSQTSDIAERAWRSALAAFPQLDGSNPFVAALAAVDTTALGCRLIDGLALPTPIKAFRVEFRLDDEPFALHVSADGGMVQSCDERFPNLGAGVIPLVRARMDSDGDGIADGGDACPLIAGVFAIERAGCPNRRDGDRDGDGTPNARDDCPDQAGAAAANGCALMRDEDGDGVPDHVDICPADIGVNRQDFALGCPDDGSGSSQRQRGADDFCLAGGDAPIYADRSEDADIIGALNDEPSAVIGRTAAKDWVQLANGWVRAGDVLLSSACYNIPLVNPTPGGATGCYLRPRAEYANVRQAPGGKHVSRLYANRSFPALGRNLKSDWLYFRAGWAHHDVLALSGSCDELPILDPAKVASGVIHFCAPDYPGLLPPRIDIGERNARIASHSIANRLRAAPDIAAEQIGEIPPRAVLDAVLDGPACKDSHVWWQVETAGVVGWTVESDLNFNFYYLEPTTSADEAVSASKNPLVGTLAFAEQTASNRIIHSANAVALDTIGLLAMEAPRQIAWSPDGTELAVVTDDGTINRYVYPDLTHISTVAAPADSRRATVTAYHPLAAILAIGGADGLVTLIDLASDQPFSDAISLGEVVSHARGIAWSRAGDKLAAISGDESLKLARRAGSLKLWALAEPSIANSETLLHYHFPYPLTAVAFSADDRFLAVTGESIADEKAALWIYDVGEGELLLSKALVAMRGGASVVASPDRALGDFVYNSGDSLYQIHAESGEDRRIYHRAGELLPQFAFRRQVMPDAEALLAVATVARNGDTRLRIANALNPHSPTVAFDVAPSAIAFSLDGRALAIADLAADRALILGVTEG